MYHNFAICQPKFDFGLTLARLVAIWPIFAKNNNVDITHHAAGPRATGARNAEATDDDVDDNENVGHPIDTSSGIFILGFASSWCRRCSSIISWHEELLALVAVQCLLVVIHPMSAVWAY